MKSDLQQKVEDLGYISTQDDFNLGFVIPGRGVKGKQQSIILDEDVEEMSRQYRGQKCLQHNKRSRGLGLPAGNASQCPVMTVMRNCHPSELKAQKVPQVISIVQTMDSI